VIDVGAVVGDAILLVFTCSLLVILDGRHLKKKKKSRRLKLDTKINVTQLLEDTVRVGYDILYRRGTLSYILLSVFIKSDLERARHIAKK
jgi:hypothetical protein